MSHTGAARPARRGRDGRSSSTCVAGDNDSRGRDRCGVPDAGLVATAKAWLSHDLAAAFADRPGRLYFPLDDALGAAVGRRPGLAGGWAGEARDGRWCSNVAMLRLGSPASVRVVTYESQRSLCDFRGGNPYRLLDSWPGRVSPSFPWLADRGTGRTGKLVGSTSAAEDGNAAS